MILKDISIGLGLLSLKNLPPCLLLPNEGHRPFVIWLTDFLNNDNDKTPKSLITDQNELSEEKKNKKKNMKEKDARENNKEMRERCPAAVLCVAPYCFAFKVVVQNREPSLL